MGALSKLAPSAFEVFGAQRGVYVRELIWKKISAINNEMSALKGALCELTLLPSTT